MSDLPENIIDFSSLRIRLASPEEVLSWSHGEVVKPETINYRTLRAEKDGLFDERIFGPTKDWECYCGKYKRVRYKGIVCDRCGVEVTRSRVRRERMGHIKLAAPVVHTWFFKGAPSKLSLLLGIAPKALEAVVYFARYLVKEVDEKGRKTAVAALAEKRREVEEQVEMEHKERLEQVEAEREGKRVELEEKIKDKDQLAIAMAEVDLTARRQRRTAEEEWGVQKVRVEQIFSRMKEIVETVAVLDVLTEEEYGTLVEYGAAGFMAVGMGAEAVAEVIRRVNLDDLAVSLRGEIKETGGGKQTKAAQRLKLVDGLRRAGVKPEWMVVAILPVLPPDLRPMVQLSGGRFATSDLNDLYRRVINRNNRLRHLMDLGAPEIIMRNEKRMLQESVDALIDSSGRTTGRRGRQMLKSLSDMLRGKQGRFRQNLLGKRVDYSGRSVIVVGPELRLDQCGLPKDMALEMFKPYVLREMIMRGLAPNVKSAKNVLERRPPEVFDILDEITREHPVLLNRAPTLHKLGIQAFYPILVGGSAIRIHPTVCDAYNADFDGDQMAVHVPLSRAAIDEAKQLMLARHNLLRPADGTVITIPAKKELALGIYYLTEVGAVSGEGEGSVFADFGEIKMAYELGKIGLRQLVKVRHDGEVIETTVGRVWFNDQLPESLRFINQAVSGGDLKQIFGQAFLTLSEEELVGMIDKVKDLSFKGGTISGLSFGIRDNVIHPDKAKIIGEAEQEIAGIEANFRQGLVTGEERRRLAQEVWMETTEHLTDLTWELLPKGSPIRVMISAKAGRVSRDTVKQLAAMRGLVVDPLGKIVELPTKGNFREGLSVFEYVTSARGGRKGLTDTALKTADAGYLTRRLVDVSHDVIVREEDCGTDGFWAVKKEAREKTFGARLLGRMVGEKVKVGRKVIAAAGEMIDEAKAAELVKAGAREVAVRSPLTCKSRHGICRACYGWDFATKQLIEVGTPVGVIAAQSIGEPGTQLTLRTKHSGGVVGLDVTQGLPRVEELFEARTPKTAADISEISGKVKVEETEDSYQVTIRSVDVKPVEEKTYEVPKTAKLLLKTGDLIAAGQQLSGGHLDIKELLAVRGLRETQRYLINELQAVYESQGIPIHDKHFEVIVREMSDKVRVSQPGDTRLLLGEIIERALFEEENERVLAEGGEAALGQLVVMGITRSALYTDSWLSAASFERTTSVLTDAALEGKEDRLLGLKENVIIGRLIPVSVDRASLG